MINQTNQVPRRATSLLAPSKEEITFWRIWGKVVGRWPTGLADIVREDVVDCSGVGTCGVHVPVRHGEKDGYGCVAMAVGSFGPVARANVPGVVQRCDAEVGARVRDRQVAVLALSDEPFVRFLTSGVYRPDKFVNGTEKAVEDFGAGFCYLRLFESAARLRVARVLGPLPLLADVLRMFLVIGPRQVDSVWVERIVEDLHIESCGGRGQELAPGVRSRSLRTFIALAQWVNKTGGQARVGASERLTAVDVEVSGGPVVVAHGGVEIERRVEKVHCARCDYFVNPVDHELRCGLGQVSAREPRKELIGDAVHALDVKLAVVRSKVLDSMLTKVVTEYISASAQKQYLESVRPGVIAKHRSLHSWGSAFERAYEGQFRQAYLEWMVIDIGLKYGYKE